MATATSAPRSPNRNERDLLTFPSRSCRCRACRPTVHDSLGGLRLTARYVCLWTELICSIVRGEANKAGSPGSAWGLSHPRVDWFPVPSSIDVLGQAIARVDGDPNAFAYRGRS